MYYFYYLLILWKTCKLAPRLSVSSTLNKVVLFLKCRNEIEEKNSRKLLKRRTSSRSGGIWKWKFRPQTLCTHCLRLAKFPVGSLKLKMFAKCLVIPKYNGGWIIFSITFEFSTQQRQIHDKFTCEALDHILKDRKYKCLHRYDKQMLLCFCLSLGICA